MGQIKFTVTKVNIDPEFGEYDGWLGGLPNIQVQCFVDNEWGVKSKEVVADKVGDADDLNQDYIYSNV